MFVVRMQSTLNTRCPFSFSYFFSLVFFLSTQGTTIVQPLTCRQHLFSPAARFRRHVAGYGGESNRVGEPLGKTLDLSPESPSNQNPALYDRRLPRLTTPARSDGCHEAFQPPTSPRCAPMIHHPAIRINAGNFFCSGLAQLLSSRISYLLKFVKYSYIPQNLINNSLCVESSLVKCT